MRFRDYKETAEATASEPLPYDSSPPPSASSPQHLAARGFWQAFSIHPAAVGFAIADDLMVSAVDYTTVGITAPALWLISGAATFVVTFMAQKKWAGDDSTSAFIRSFLLSFLVSLPTPFPMALALPSAVAGMIQVMRGGKE